MPKFPEIRRLNNIEVVVLPDGWDEGGRFETETDYIRACGKKYAGKKVMTKYEFRQAKRAKYSPTQRAQHAFNTARSAV